MRAYPSDLWAVRLQPGADAAAVAASVGFDLVGTVSVAPDTYVLRRANTDSSLTDKDQAASALSAAPQVIWFEQQFYFERAKRGAETVIGQDAPITLGDPLYGDQWHLENNAQFEGIAGEDANVQPAWNLGYDGTGVQIAIVDDGLEYTHPDLAPNYTPDGSYDFNFNDPDPFSSFSDDAHGTSVAGVAAARDESTCGVGVAYRANIAGVRLLSGFTTDVLEADALNHALNVNDISSNSWGPVDSGTIFGGVGPFAQLTLENGVQNGRGGLGTIYVWAGGNGRAIGDYANADAYVNSRYTIGVGAVDNTGEQAPYSEPGAAIHVVAPSNGSTVGITTTDRSGALGYNGYPANPECTNGFGGTSSATPLVSGVVALMLEANPTLTWRDVQHILAETASVTDPSDPDWTFNDAGYLINHKYGFGRVDAFAAVNLAHNWINVSPSVSYASSLTTVNAAIPNNASAVTQTVNMVIPDGSFRMEHAVVQLNINHQERGDLEIILTSPRGTQSVLLAPRLPDTGDNIVDYPFMTVRNWGEDAGGTWTLSVRDTNARGTSGTLVDWQLILYGNTGSSGQQLMFFNQPSDGLTNAVLGGSGGLSVGLMDRHGVPLTLGNVLINLDLSANPNGGALLGTLSARTDNNGIATFPNVRIAAPGDYIIRAYSRTFDWDYTDSFRVYQPTAGLIFRTEPTNTIAGGLINDGVGVRAMLVDSAGVIVPLDGVPVTLAIENNPAAGTLAGTLTVNTLNGIATFPDLSIAAVGNGYTLRATSGAFTDVSVPFNIYPAGLTLQFRYSTPDALHFNQIIDGAFGGVQVRVVDSGGTIVDVDGIAVTMTDTGPGSLIGTTVVDLVDGIGLFTDLRLNAPGTHTLSASVPLWTTATTQPFEVTTLTGQFCASDLDAAWAGSLPILDNDPNGTFSTITIPPLAVDPVDDITVTLDVEHTYVGDTFFYLVHQGVERAIAVPPGSCSGNDLSVYLDDAATLDISVNCTSGFNPTPAYVLGESYLPTQSLAPFNGTSLSGDWTLFAYDTFGGDDGFVYEWCINMELPAAQLAFLAQPADTEQGEIIGDVDGFSSLAIEVQDVSGTVVPVDGLPITLALDLNAASGTLTGTTTVNTIDGLAVFNNLRIAQPNTYTLRASATGLADVVSSEFDITPVNLITNGDFDEQLTEWNVFDAITWQFTGGVFEFYRNQGGESAVIFQDTGEPMMVDDVLMVEVDLGNTSAVRKRVSLLVHNPNFSDLQICSFWIAPNTPLATYRMHLSAPTAWTSAVLSIYGSPADGVGWIQVDNAGMFRMPGSPGLTETLCIDPHSPPVGAGADSANIIQNGTFTGSLAPWGTFGAIIARHESDTAEMYRTFGTPAGSMLQNTGVAAPDGVPMEIRLDLANSSTIRQRATVIVHATDFSDLQVCVFWLEAGTPMQTYVIRTHTTTPWAGTSVSIYPSPATNLGWIRMDNVSAVVKPTMTVTGTECYMPGSSVSPGMPPAPISGGAPLVSAPVVLQAAPPEQAITMPMQPVPEYNGSVEGTVSE
jgi:subtilisin-like proprotein convertase family protein